MATLTNEQIARGQTIAKILGKHGYNKNSQVGVVANLHWESAGLNPNANEYGGGGYGLGQWTPKSNLYRQAQICGLSNAQAETLEGQAEIIAQGDKTGQWMDNTTVSSAGYTNPQTLSAFKKSTNIDVATINFMCHWERPGKLHIEERLDLAQAYSKHIDGSGGGGVKRCYGTPIKNTNLDPSSFMSGQLFGTHAGNGRPNNFHDGLDFGSIDHPGNEMIACCDGTVTHVGTMGALRAYFVINDGTYNIVYQEFSYSQSNIKVKVGDRVKNGQVCAIRDADHLHLGFTKKDFMTALGSSFVDDGTWEDPLKFLGQCFGDGDNGGDNGDNNKGKNDLIYLWLSDSLNGWKF